MFCRVVDGRYVVGGSKTGDVNRDNARRDRFLINTLPNGEGGFTQYIWPTIYIYIYIYIYTYICIRTKNVYKI